MTAICYAITGNFRIDISIKFFYIIILYICIPMGINVYFISKVRERAKKNMVTESARKRDLIMIELDS